MTRPRHTADAAGFARELRRETTISEDRLWSRIRRRAIGVRFRRQVPIGRYVADFACFDPRLVIEVDGASHEFRDESHRTAHLESLGFTVLRFTNSEIRRSIDDVVEVIANQLQMLEQPCLPP